MLNRIGLINPFVPKASFLYPPENIRKPYGFFMFQKVEKRRIGNKLFSAFLASFPIFYPLFLAVIKKELWPKIGSSNVKIYCSIRNYLYLLVQLYNSLRQSRSDYKSARKMIIQPAITCSKLTMETLDQFAKSVQS